jgi:hypothetical protein
MSSLVAPRPPGWRMREDDDRQGSLFGGEALQPPARRVPEPASPEAPTQPAPPRDEVAEPPRDVPAPPRDDVPAPPRDDVPATPEARTAPPRDAVAAPPDAAAAPPIPPREFVVPDEDAEEIRVSRAGGRQLTGPTLDDAVSRAWEGLVAEVPAACPVCHGEIEPVLGAGVQGHCRNCHVTLD